MANPTSDTDYPGFSGATCKRDILRALMDYAHESTGLMAVILRINRSDLATITDGDTHYDTANNFQSAEA